MGTKKIEQRLIETIHTFIKLGYPHSQLNGEYSISDLHHIINAMEEIKDLDTNSEPTIETVIETIRNYTKHSPISTDIKLKVLHNLLDAIELEIVRVLRV